MNFTKTFEIFALLSAIVSQVNCGGGEDTLILGGGGHGGHGGKGNYIKHEGKGDLILVGLKSSGGDVIQHNGKKGDLIILSEHDDHYDEYKPSDYHGHHEGHKYVTLTYIPKYHHDYEHEQHHYSPKVHHGYEHKQEHYQHQEPQHYQHQEPQHYTAPVERDVAYGPDDYGHQLYGHESFGHDNQKQQ